MCLLACSIGSYASFRCLSFILYVFFLHSYGLFFAVFTLVLSWLFYFSFYFCQSVFIRIFVLFHSTFVERWIDRSIDRSVVRAQVLHSVAHFFFLLFFNKMNWMRYQNKSKISVLCSSALFLLLFLPWVCRRKWRLRHRCSVGKSCNNSKKHTHIIQPHTVHILRTTYVKSALLLFLLLFHLRKGNQMQFLFCFASISGKEPYNAQYFMPSVPDENCRVCACFLLYFCC